MRRQARLLSIVALTISSGLFAFAVDSFVSDATSGPPKAGAAVLPVPGNLVSAVSSFDPLRSDYAQHQKIQSEVLAFYDHVQGYQYQQAQAAAAQAAQRASEVQYTAPVTTVTQSAPTSGDWSAVAVCEEGGNNDPTYGYFGIMPGNWPPGESPANMSYAQQVALGNSINGGSAPSEAGGCHSW